MAILTPPATPRFRAGSSIRPLTNTVSFEAPLNKSVQTLEFAGAHWVGQYALPTMLEADGETWAAFLTELDGPAGRFYAGDPFRITPRGVATTIAARDNQTSNDTMQGATVGTVGAGGLLPPGWVFGNVGGRYTLVIDAVGPDGDVDAMDITISGTNNSGSPDFPTVAPGSIMETPTVQFDDWVIAAWGRHFGTPPSPVTEWAISERDSGGGQLSSASINFATTETLTRYERTKTFINAGAAYAQSRLIWNVPDTVSLSASLRIGLPYMTKGTVAPVDLRTTNAARSVPAGPYVEGAGQTGKTLVTGGWTPSITGILLAGDYVSANLPSGGRSMHKLTADADSDIAGEATLAIRPPLRESPAADEPLLIAPATCVMRLTDDSQAAWTISETGLYTIAFEAVESFNEGA